MIVREENLLTVLNSIQKILELGEKKIHADKKPTMLLAEQSKMGDLLNFLAKYVETKKV